ncbi:MAG: JAB domain-containing protein [Polyangiaceae bacterium]
MVVSTLSERIARDGLESVEDADLLTLVFSDEVRSWSDGRARAVAWLELYGGLNGVARASPFVLAEQGPMAARDAFRIAAAVEIGQRVARRRSSGEPVPAFPESRAVDDWARPRLSSLDHEELWLLALDGRNHLRAAKRVAQGGLHGLHVSTRDPLRFALREAASAFILVHNHPSGDPTPSDEDLVFTHRIETAGTLVGAPLLDHVVVASSGFVSMADEGLLACAVSGPRDAESRAPRRGSRGRGGTRRSLPSRGPS